MKPASTTRSGSPASIAAASAASKRIALGESRGDRPRVAMPARAAMLEPPRASARLRDARVTHRPPQRAGVALRGEQRREIRAAARDEDGDAGSIASWRCGTRDAGVGPRPGVTRRRSPARLRRLARRSRRCGTRARRLPSSSRSPASACSGGDHDDHADAAVEHAMHLGVGDVAVRAAASRRSAVAASASASMRACNPGGQHPRDVLEQAAAGDVRHALDRHRRACSAQHRLHVDARRREQRVAERGRAVEWARRGRRRVASTMRRISEKPLRVRPARREAEHDVAGGDARGRR